MPEETPQKNQTTGTEKAVSLEWTAPGRPFQKRGKQFYLTALLIMLLFEIIFRNTY